MAKIINPVIYYTEYSMGTMYVATCTILKDDYELKFKSGVMWCYDKVDEFKKEYLRVRFDFILKTFWLCDETAKEYDKWISGVLDEIPTQHLTLEEFDKNFETQDCEGKVYSFDKV